MGRKRKAAHLAQDTKTITSAGSRDFSAPDVDGAHLYAREHELPWDLQPYWKHRHSIFSLYDNGIWTTDDSWFEVTHECIAKKIAEHVAVARPNNKIILLDCFAGIGGNAIAFALSGYKRVYAIEKNLAALECARHNARIYGVHDRITFFHGDCFELLGLDGAESGKAIGDLVMIIRKAGIIFASPPWGGPGYKQEGEVMDLNKMPYTLKHMAMQFSSVADNVVLYLPRTSDLNQIADCADVILQNKERQGGEGGREEPHKAQIVHYCIHENSKALCAYLGDWEDIEV